MNALERAQELLREAKLLVYEPGQHPGECKAPYVVVYNNGTYPMINGKGLAYTLLSVGCFVPLSSNQSKTLVAHVAKVKAVMAGMKNQARPTGNESPDEIASAYKAFARTVEYQVLKRQEE